MFAPICVSLSMTILVYLFGWPSLGSSINLGDAAIFTSILYLWGLWLIGFFIDLKKEPRPKFYLGFKVYLPLTFLGICLIFVALIALEIDRSCVAKWGLL